MTACVYITPTVEFPCLAKNSQWGVTAVEQGVTLTTNNYVVINLFHNPFGFNVLSIGLQIDLIRCVRKKYFLQ